MNSVDKAYRTADWRTDISREEGDSVAEREARVALMAMRQSAGLNIWNGLPLTERDFRGEGTSPDKTNSFC